MESYEMRDGADLNMKTLSEEHSSWSDAKSTDSNYIGAQNNTPHDWSVLLQALLRADDSIFKTPNDGILHL